MYSLVAKRVSDPQVAHLPPGKAGRGKGMGDVKTQSVDRGSGYHATLSAMVRGVKREAEHKHMIGVQCALCLSSLSLGLPRPHLSLIEGTRCEKLSSQVFRNLFLLRPPFAVSRP